MTSFCSRTNSSVTQIFSGGESLYFSNNSFMTTEIEISSGPVLLAKQIAARFEAIPEVAAVALAGSQTSPFADQRSDIDLYVYASEPVALSSRAEVARDARQAEIGNSFWEPGDEWIDGETGISVDVMFRATPWIEDQLDRVLRRHEASVGYSTCFWYNVRNSQPQV
jgi:predicted nucleotidyltransferase